MLKGFVQGKWYLYEGPAIVRAGWHPDMAFVYEERIPYKCLMGSSTAAAFETSDSVRAWNWSDGIEYWREVDAPPEKEREIGTKIVLKKGGRRG